MEKKEKINLYTLSFLIATIVCLGGLNFLINKDTIDNFMNYYIIFIAGVSSIILFINNIENYKWSNIKKVPLVLSGITLIWFGLTIIFGIHFNMANIKGLVNFGALFLILNIIINLNMTELLKEKLIKVFLASFVVTAFLGVIQYFSGVNLVTYSNYLYPGILGRINSTFYIATLYDKYVLIVVPIIFYLILKSQKKSWANLLIFLSGIAMILTFSRSGILIYFSLLGIYFLVMVLQKKVLPMVTILLTLLAMLLIPGANYAMQASLDYVYSVIKTPEKYQIDLVALNPYLTKFYVLFKADEKEIIESEDMQSPSLENQDENIDATDEEAIDVPIDAPTAEDNKPVEDNQSIFVREQYKAMGKQLIKEHPIFGIGVGNYSYLYTNQNFRDYLKDDSVYKLRNDFLYPHNGYIHLTAEVGYVGTLLTILTIISMLYPFKSNNKKWEIFTCFMLLYAFLFSGFIESIFHSKQYTFSALIIYAIMIAYLTSKDVKNRKKKN